MRWHISLICEAVLIAAISWRKPGLRWFGALIGVDFIASLYQLIPYRAGLVWHSRLIWITGVIIGCPLLLRALVEASTHAEKGAIWFWHARYLWTWTAVHMAIYALQTQSDLVIPMNHVLLIFDSVSFLSWAALFLIF